MPENSAVTRGVQLSVFVLEGHRHHGELLYDWILLRAREMGIVGGAAYREIAGYGRHRRLHEQSFFELAGDLPVEVKFAISKEQADQLLAFLDREAPSVFYIKTACEFGRTGESDIPS